MYHIKEISRKIEYGSSTIPHLYINICHDNILYGNYYTLLSISENGST